MGGGGVGPHKHAAWSAYRLSLVAVLTKECFVSGRGPRTDMELARV